ncbi:MAG: TRAP transporter permease [Alphaproteobacteria bacterium]|nr:TRAP transporter permease [Alphaproteobacteria bacterium]
MMTQDEANRLAAEVDLGAREPKGQVGRFLFFLALAWALFQLFYASPLPFIFSAVLMDDAQTRAVHLAFGMFLAFTAFPAFRRSPRDRVPVTDWLWGIAAACACLYIPVFYSDIANRGGTIYTRDIAVALVGFACLFEATRRSIGLPLVIVGAVFIAFAFLGPYMPDVIAHRGAGLNRFVEHMWITTEGIFGIALGVSSSVVFLFVVFGTLLDQAGAGNWLMKLCFSTLGHLRGGPAKASVVSSALNGLFSGSAIANVVTGGLFTIPLMKRVGFSPEKAAAVEVSSSLNGQIMPPVMGAAAFLMAEYLGVPYAEVVKAAFIPAVISYIALFYIVHLEAVKLDMPLLERRVKRAIHMRIAYGIGGLGAFAVACLLSYELVEVVRALLPGREVYATIALFVVAYLVFLSIAARYPDLENDAGNPSLVMPEFKPTLMAGLHYILPIFVLIYSLMVDYLSAGLAVYWAILALFVITLTQRPLLALFRGRTLGIEDSLARGLGDIILGLVAGSRNMVGIAIAMASAGIIVGVVSLTGVGLLMTEVIRTIAGDNLMAVLLMTAAITLVLGMGLPTTANYVVVAAVMAPVLPALAAQQGLIVPPIAAHLFIFYFGLLSGVTPPVAVDAYAGAALAKADPVKTCLMAFFYSARTAVLPFIFIFNTDLLLIGVDSVWHFLLVFGVSVTAMLAFVAVTFNFMLVRNRIWETVTLAVACVLLFRPGMFLDQIYPPFSAVPAQEILSFVERQPPGALVRMWVSGQNFSGDDVRKVVVLPLGPRAENEPGMARLRRNAGLVVSVSGNRVNVMSMTPRGPAERAGLDAGWQIERLEVPTERPDKEWLLIPGLLLAGLVLLLQRARRPRNGNGGGLGAPATTAAAMPPSTR